jgi:hypothetical protein
MAFLAVAAPYISAASAGLSAVQAYSSAQQQSKTASYNAKVAEANATSQRQWAEYEATNLEREAKAQRGRLTAAMGASGVQTGTGSFLDVLTDDAMTSELDALSLRLQGEQRGRFYDADAAGQRAQGRYAKRMAPVSALTAGLRGFTAAGGSFGSSTPPTSNATIRWTGPRVGAV